MTSLRLSHVVGLSNEARILQFGESLRAVLTPRLGTDLNSLICFQQSANIQMSFWVSVSLDS
jgi:hypothetical protein